MTKSNVPRLSDKCIPRELHGALLDDTEPECSDHVRCAVCLEFFPEEDMLTCSYCEEMFCPDCESEGSKGNCQSCVEDF